MVNFLLRIVLGINNGNVRVWELLNNDIMINQILANEKIAFPENRKFSVWVDSGGYQILMKNMKISLKSVAEKYESLDADYYMSLDIPASDPSKVSMELVKINIQNYCKLSKLLPDKRIIPIVHLYPAELMIRAVEEYVNLGSRLVAYGGIIPPLLKKTKLRLKSLIGFIILRKAFPSIKFHVLGTGSYLMIRIMEALEAYSIDTSSWRVKAAYGHVIVPGVGERYVGTKNIKFNTPKAKKEDIENLYEELRKSGFPYINEFYQLLKTFKGRALINAWVISKVNKGISKKSSFFKLYNKLMELRHYSLEKLINMYDGGK